jgi:ABC-2 type transport system ATP-binding protein
MMTAVIEVTGLTKRYGGRTGQAAVDDISFHVDKGEIFGILGPNGAGKTTAVECMEGLRRRDGGEVRILGLDPRTNRHLLHQRIGVQLQETQLQEKLRVREALELYASFYPNPADWHELLERCRTRPRGQSASRSALLWRRARGSRGGSASTPPGPTAGG